MASVFGLPPALTDGDKTFPTESVIGADVEYVLLYFSAHWCPPCRSFTPVLSSWAAENSARLKFKVVFASSDRDETSFKAYLSEMSWKLAIPFGDASKDALSKRMKVSGIPTLCVLDRAGNCVTDAGRGKVQSDPSGAAFPWRPRGIWDVLASASIVDRAGARVDIGTLRARSLTGLYFSAHWCPPCRQFTPTLAAWYDEQVVRGPLAGRTDIVFVSSDRDEKTWAEYYGEMPWKALAFADRAAKEELSTLLGVEGIPTLSFIDEGGKVVIANARGKIVESPTEFPWPPKPVVPISDAMDFINAVPTVVMWVDKVSDAVQEVAAAEALDAVAASHFKDGAPSPRIRFALVTSASADAGDSIRSFLGAAHTRDRDGDNNARITIVDVPSRRKALFRSGALGIPTAEELAAFVDSFLAGNAPLVGIKD